MYALILLIIIAAGVCAIRQGMVRSRRGMIIGGVVIPALGTVFFSALDLWGELLWFTALGLERRFWLFLDTRIGALFAGAALAALIAALIVRGVHSRWFRSVVIAVAALGSGWWGALGWSELLVFINQVITGQVDPMFGKDTGFFLFSLPFYDRLYGLARYSVLVGIGGVLVGLLLHARDSGLRLARQMDDRKFLMLLTTGSALLAMDESDDVAGTTVVVDGGMIHYSDSRGNGCL